jgi:uncharacterized membrane protein (UPF0136 family)
MLAMTSTHAQRILTPLVRPSFGQFLMDWEPVIPTVFSILLGLGLAYSLESSRDQAVWARRQRQRALWLWLLSALLFFVRFGPQWPAMLISTGILQCLGIGILCVTVAAPSGALSLSAGVFLFLVWTGLEGRGLHIDGLNQGSFPVFPYIPFVLLSFGVARLVLRRRHVQWGLGAAGVLATWFLWHRLGWGHLGTPGSGFVLNHQILSFTRPAQVEGFTLTWDILHGVATWPVDLAFWHTQPRLALFLVTACSTGAFLLATLAGLLRRPFALLALAGRHSLPYYVLHFAGLGAFLLLPEEWHARPWSWAVGTVATYLAATALFGLREHLRRKADA